MTMLRFPFQGFFQKVGKTLGLKAKKFKDHRKPSFPPRSVVPQELTRRPKLITWLLLKDYPRNILPWGKAMMLRLAEDKRERKRKRNFASHKKTRQEKLPGRPIWPKKTAVRLLNGDIGRIESYQGDGFYRVIIETNGESIERVELPAEDIEIISGNR